MALIKAVMIPLDPSEEDLEAYVRAIRSCCERVLGLDPPPLDDERPADVDESE